MLKGFMESLQVHLKVDICSRYVDLYANYCGQQFPPRPTCACMIAAVQAIGQGRFVPSIATFLKELMTISPECDCAFEILQQVLKDLDTTIFQTVDFGFAFDPKDLEPLM